MKKYILSVVLLSTLLVVYSCEKDLIDQNQQWQFTDASAANARFINTFTSAITGVVTTRFLGYQDGNRFMGNGLVSPGTWPITGYVSLKPGSSSLLLVQDRKILPITATLSTPAVPGSITPPVAGDTAMLKTITMDASKFYSHFLVGAAPTQELISVEDKIPALDSTQYALRLANMVTDPLQPIRIFSRREKRDIITNIAYKQISDFVILKFDPAPDTLDVFAQTGTVRLYGINTSPNSRGRTYTLYTHGRTGFRVPTISFYTNK